MQINNNHTYFFIKYPMCSGGAHLANLISLDNNFVPKDQSSGKNDFIENLEKFYTKLQPYDWKNDVSLLDKHIDNHFLIGDDRWETLLTDINNKFSNYKKSVHIGHNIEFFSRKDIISRIINKKYILINLETKQDIEMLMKREKKMFRTFSLVNEYHKIEASYYYDNLLHENNEIEECDVLRIPIHTLFSHNILPVLDKINQQFDCNIPIDLASKIHETWYNKNFE